ncbi:MAG: helix-turn-helix domain-containing protein [Dysgonomonas sp.]
MVLYIKNMVCPRCVMAVENIFRGLKIEIAHIQLGEVVVKQDNLSNRQLTDIRAELGSMGFELLDDAQQQIIERIKLIIIEQIQNDEPEKQETLSELLVAKLHRDYSFLSKLFSTTEGITIEHYTILQKIEKVKELLSYDQLNLSEIAFRLNYSSVAHLSSQFKKVTGLTPSRFKEQSSGLRRSIDGLK